MKTEVIRFTGSDHMPLCRAGKRNPADMDCGYNFVKEQEEQKDRVAYFPYF